MWIFVYMYTTRELIQSQRSSFWKKKNNNFLFAWLLSVFGSYYIFAYSRFCVHWSVVSTIFSQTFTIRLKQPIDNSLENEFISVSIECKERRQHLLFVYTSHLKKVFRLLEILSNCELVENNCESEKYFKFFALNIDKNLILWLKHNEFVERFCTNPR